MTDERAAEDVEPAARSDRRRHGLRRQWLSAFVVMLSLVVATGTSALLSSQYVVTEFQHTAERLEAAGAFAAELNTAIIEHEEVLHDLLDGQRLHPADVLSSQHSLEAAFAAGRTRFSDPDLQDVLVRAESRWRASLTDAGTWGPELATELRTDDRLAHERLGSGTDETVALVHELNAVARRGLQADLRHAERSRLVAFGLVGAVLTISLLAMLHFARRMSLDLLRPLEALQHGLGRVRAGELDHQVQFPALHRESELTDLATGFNEMAAQLALTHRELTFRAMHDSLTGLPNRLALRERLAVGFADSAARREQPDVSVLFVDLDDFKVVNDTLGHAGGDELLVQVAQRLAACIGSDDTVGRLGGDEFAIVVTGECAVTAAGTAERVLGALSAPFVVAGHPVAVSASIGIGVTGPDTASPDELLGHADFAMYMAKGQGKQRYEVYDEVLHSVTTDHAALRSELREAADNGQLRLDYQPVVDLDTGAVVGVEALLRWQHPVRGLVPPLEFIPIAEQSGDIDAIGLWVLRTAMRQLARWRAAGDRTDLWLAVNLSPVQLRNERLVGQLVDLLSTGPVPADAVVLEVTESALVLGVGGAVDALQRLKGTGARIALDDFGTGSSSLSTLAGLPVDILKIDRAFVSGQDGGVPSTAVLQMVLALADHLSLDVIAEGVEEPAQQAVLRTLGCRLGQGFLLARPAPADLLTELLQQPGPRVPAPRPPGISERGAAHTA